MLLLTLTFNVIIFNNIKMLLTNIINKSNQIYQSFPL